MIARRVLSASWPFVLLFFRTINALPRITTKVDPQSLISRFYSPSSGIFFPRGANFIKLNASQGTFNNREGVYHALFSPQFYSPTEVREQLDGIRSYGYEFVRVLIDGGEWARIDGINGNGSELLNSAYLDNVVDFVMAAGSMNIYTLITFDSLPKNRAFSDILSGSATPASNIEFPNSKYLCSYFRQAYMVYVRSFAQQMSKRLNGDTSPIFAYSVAHEGSYSMDALPFSRYQDIRVHAADGSYCDMSSPSSRQRCADQNSLAWVNILTRAIKEVDPQVLVTCGVATFQSVGLTRGPNGLRETERSSTSYPFRPSILTSASSLLDFLDIHIHPLSTLGDRNPEWSFEAELESSQWYDVGFEQMPILMGELGAYKHVFKDVSSAAGDLQALQTMSWSRQFSGWAVWTWACKEHSELYWTAIDGKEAIARILAPHQRASPKVKKSTREDGLDIPDKEAIPQGVPEDFTVAPIVG